MSSFLPPSFFYSLLSVSFACIILRCHNTKRGARKTDGEGITRSSLANICTINREKCHLQKIASNCTAELIGATRSLPGASVHETGRPIGCEESSSQARMDHTRGGPLFQIKLGSLSSIRRRSLRCASVLVVELTSISTLVRQMLRESRRFTTGRSD